MYEIRLFDGGTTPWAIMVKPTKEESIEFAKFLVRGENATWRAEVWSPEDRMVYLSSPPVK